MHGPSSQEEKAALHALPPTRSSTHIELAASASSFLKMRRASAGAMYRRTKWTHASSAKQGRRGSVVAVVVLGEGGRRQRTRNLFCFVGLTREAKQRGVWQFGNGRATLSVRAVPRLTCAACVNQSKPTTNASRTHSLSHHIPPPPGPFLNIYTHALSLSFQYPRTCAPHSPPPSPSWPHTPVPIPSGPALRRSGGRAAVRRHGAPRRGGGRCCVKVRVWGGKEGCVVALPTQPCVCVHRYVPPQDTRTHAAHSHPHPPQQHRPRLL